MSLYLELVLISKKDLIGSSEESIPEEETIYFAFILNEKELYPCLVHFVMVG